MIRTPTKGEVVDITTIFHCLCKVVSRAKKASQWKVETRLGKIWSKVEPKVLTDTTDVDIFLLRPVVVLLHIVCFHLELLSLVNSRFWFLHHTSSMSTGQEHVIEGSHLSCYMFFIGKLFVDFFCMTGIEWHRWQTRDKSL